MATIQHKNLPNADLHEPKGVSGASSGDAYISDGAGSGAWQEVLSPTDATAANQIFKSDGSSSGSWAALPSAVHGSMYIAEESNPTTITLTNTYYQVTEGWVSQDSDGVTPDPTNSVLLTTDTSASHVVHGSVEFTGANGDKYVFVIGYDVAGGTDFTQVNNASSATIDGIGAIESIPIDCYIADIPAGTSIALQVQNEGGTDDVTVSNAILFVSEVG